MVYIQAHLLVPGDMGGVEIARSSPRVRSKLKIGDMEANVWSRLPDSLLTDVLKRLPLISNLRFRSVCREWYRVLPSYSPPPTRAICLFGTSVKICDTIHSSVHDSLPCKENPEDESSSCSTLKTIKLDFSFLPQGELLQPCAAGGGLMCFKRNRAKKRGESASCSEDFFICNPVTKKYKQLTGEQNDLLVPADLDDDFVQVIYELIVDDSSKYKFIVGRVGNSLIKLHIYDSRTSSWTKEVTPEPPHPHHSMHWDLETIPVFQNGQLKIIYVPHMECEIDKSDKRNYTAFPVSNGSSYCVVGAQDSLFAVEVVMSPNKGVDLWRQDIHGSTWENISALPPDSAKNLLECFRARKFPEDQHLHCHMCWFNEDFLCIKLSTAKTHRMLTFHLKAKRWQIWHANFTFLPHVSPCYTMFSYTPSLEQVPES